MRCGSSICQECATQWEGINYCASCLGEIRHPSAGNSSARGWIALSLTGLLLFAALLWLRVWMGVLVAALR